MEGSWNSPAGPPPDFDRLLALAHARRRRSAAGVAAGVACAALLAVTIGFGLPDGGRVDVAANGDAVPAGGDASLSDGGALGADVDVVVVGPLAGFADFAGFRIDVPAGPDETLVSDAYHFTTVSVLGAISVPVQAKERWTVLALSAAVETDLAVRDPVAGESLGSVHVPAGGAVVAVRHANQNGRIVLSRSDATSAVLQASQACPEGARTTDGAPSVGRSDGGPPASAVVEADVVSLPPMSVDGGCP